MQTANLPNGATEECLARLSAEATVRKLVMVIHGFTKEFETEWMHEMQRDIMRLDAGTAVVVRRRSGAAAAVALMPMPTNQSIWQSVSDRRLGTRHRRHIPLLPRRRKYQVCRPPRKRAYAFESEVWQRPKTNRARSRF